MSWNGQLLRDAADEALMNSYNGANEFQDALHDWWREEAAKDEPSKHAIRAAKAYLRGDQ